MSKTKKDWISNWLIIEGNVTQSSSGQKRGLVSTDDIYEEEMNSSKKMKVVTNSAQSKKRKNKPKLLKLQEVEETELTQSPISGTYIIKEWDSEKTTTSKQKPKEGFSKAEVQLNKIAASFVQITPAAKAKLAKIPNKIGPFECKLCKVVYKDAFELAMHDCPRVVSIEYKCSECNKLFNSPANLASHKRWHRPKLIVNKSNDEKPSFRVYTKPQETPINQESELLTRLFVQHYSEALASHLPSNLISHDQNGLFGNLNLNQSDWISQAYSNYIAAHKLFSNFNLSSTHL